MVIIAAKDPPRVLVASINLRTLESSASEVDVAHDYDIICKVFYDN